MASYIQNTLIKDEKVIYEGKISIWSLIPLFVVGLILLPVFGLGLLFWIEPSFDISQQNLHSRISELLQNLDLLADAPLSLILQKLKACK